jgi:hypothetical protein
MTLVYKAQGEGRNGEGVWGLLMEARLKEW